ncbi:hypothetical protein I79_004048 [Cricetulus griseus]|uniref:Uncharacterized protein n=1 Tax=Cricetulus griseus TaxID=10029 RepID=G3H1N8_CRIGR|nr:hypothetical protein I79_004048 [Cricetulus griseus]
MPRKWPAVLLLLLLCSLLQALTHVIADKSLCLSCRAKKCFPAPLALPAGVGWWVPRSMRFRPWECESAGIKGVLWALCWALLWHRMPG